MSEKYYTLYHIHTHNSLLDGFGTEDDNCKRLKQLGMKAASISDHGVISGAVKHQEACEKHNLKCIQGCELYIPYSNAQIKSSQNRGSYHQVVFCRNKQGWKDLLKIIRLTNEHFYYKPRLHLFDEPESPGLESILSKGNIISISGHQGSALSNNLFCNIFGNTEEELPKLKVAYGQYKGIKSDHYQQFLKPNWLEDTCELAIKMQAKLGGPGNFYIELQNELKETDALPLWVHPLIVDCLREVSRETGIPAIASSDPHYAFPEQAEDQRFSVMNNMKETVQSVQRKLDSSDEMDLMVFFGSDNFYIHDYEEMSKNFTQEELEQTNKILEDIEVFDIKSPPYIPKYSVPQMEFGDIPNNLPFKTDADKYTYKLAIDGAKNKKPWEKTNISKQKYWDRLQQELSIFFEAGLSDYFLMVWDVCMAADNRPSDHSFDWKNWKGEKDPIMRGRGRGSVGGSILAYFLDISRIDALKYNLKFSRFYNKGRKNSLPDVDGDYTAEGRDWVLGYLKWKYGEDKVGQIATFGAMKGRASLKDVFKIAGVGTFDEINELCKHVGEESKIVDEIQEAIEGGDDDYSIIQWTIDHKDEFREVYEKPEYKELIDKAIRFQGRYRSSGKHACGIIVSDKPLEENFPIVWDPKSKSMIVGWDMKDVEKASACKLDILSTVVLDKVKFAQELINNA